MELNKPLVIAEIAQGFEGDLSLATLFVRAAAKANANFVKFQMVYADDLATENYRHYKLFKSIEFTLDEWKHINKKATENNIELCVDIFGKQSLDAVESLRLKTIKIHPTDINNFILINKINQLPISTVILGIGGATIEEIELALNSLNPQFKVVLMHGYQAYPTPNEYNQISRISHLKKHLEGKFRNIEFGFADHVVNDFNYSVTLNAMAYVAGANYFEKHLSFGNCLELEDFESALEPDEFKQFSDDLNKAAEAFGDTENTSNFGMSEAEFTYRGNIRRKWVASKDLGSGLLLNPEVLELKRSDEESFLELSELIGKKLKSSIKKGQIIKSEYLS